MRKVQKQEKKAREREASQYVTMERAAEQGKETHIVPKILSDLEQGLSSQWGTLSVNERSEP